MSPLRIVVRALRFHHATGIVVVLAVAIATAVLVGSLVVGSSVRGSIRDTALRRLAGVDEALVAPRYFRAALADDLRSKGLADHLAATILTRGAVRNADTDAVAPGVQVVGADATVGSMLKGLPALGEGQAAVSAALARDLGLKVGSAVLVAIPRPGALAADNLFAHRRLQDTTRAARAEVVALLPDTGLGGFALDPATGLRRNLFLSRDWLASQLGVEGRANALLAAGTYERLPLQTSLRSACRPADLGLKLVQNPARTQAAVQSDSLLLTDREVTALPGGVRTSVYLANTIRRMGGGRAVPYSVVAAVGDEARPGEAAISQWTAEQTGAKPGDTLEIAYPVPRPDGSYPEAALRVRVSRVVPMASPLVDPGLAPALEGISDAQHIGDWEPPFPIDLHRIAPADEAYWDRFHAAPKVFLAADALRAMWRAGGESRWVTAVRWPRPGAGKRFADAVGTMDPQDAGLVFRPVRRLALDASEGTTDFGGLFIGMGMFLVGSAAWLVAMMMRLRVEQRAAQAGLMLACGWTESEVRRALFAEGAVLVAVGAVFGTPMGVGYAALILFGLGRWWAGAIGSTPLWLHVAPQGVATGALAGLLVGLAAVWLGARRLSGVPVLRLLSGWEALAVGSLRRAPLWRRALPWLFIGVGLSMICAPGIDRAEAFFCAGAALLLGGVLLCGELIGRGTSRAGAGLTPLGVAARSAAAGRGRGTLTVGLMASAAFLLVTVAANTRDFSRADTRRKESGTGGFSLVATTSTPLAYDLGTPQGRAQLGFLPEDEALFQGVQVFSFRQSPGEDVSCLNLARPTSPRLLGVPKAFAEHGGFTVKTERKADQPWIALLAGAPDGAVPVFGDAESVEWTLHSGLGGTCDLPAASGQTVPGRFTGLVSSSILAGHLMVSEEQLARLYPAVTGPSYFLLSVPAGRERAVADALRRTLGDAGLEVRDTREVLNSLIGVQNAYLSTFMALGGLGLLLGAVGLVAVMFENALTRRRQYALMTAVGFARGEIAGILFAEVGGLLALGLAVGTAAALIAVAPTVLSAVSRVNWPALAGVLAAIVLLGVGACAVASRVAVRGRLLEALRSE